MLSPLVHTSVLAALCLSHASATEEATAEDSTCMQLIDLEAHEHDRTVNRDAKYDDKRSKNDGPQKARWFGGFSDAESTYTSQAVGAESDSKLVRLGGYNPDQPGYVSVSTKKIGEPHEWFHESKSDGPRDAWQSSYPDVSGSVAGDRNPFSNPWEETARGWYQDYNLGEKPGDAQVGLGKNPNWFDSSVANVDGFGRNRLPDIDSRPRLSAAWSERIVNGTLTCKDPGCNAAATLKVFDTQTEAARFCQLTMHVHPTDFMDEYSREHVKDIMANDVLLTAFCDPKAKGCGANIDETLLYPCVNRQPIDVALGGKKGGSLALKASITDMVDECPYKGNLLSAVVHVNCMVRKLKNAKDKSNTSNGINATSGSNASSNASAILLAPVINMKSTLRCSEPGCVATSEPLLFSAKNARLGAKCFVSVNVTQTDFDDGHNTGPHGGRELIEWLNLTSHSGQHLNLAKNVKPGKNPCLAKELNKPLEASEMVFLAVDKKDLTDFVKKEATFFGDLLKLTVTGKISKHVDECGAGTGQAGGALLDGFVTLICNAPTAADATMLALGSTGNAGAKKASLDQEIALRRLPDKLPEKVKWLVDLFTNVSNATNATHATNATNVSNGTNGTNATNASNLFSGTNASSPIRINATNTINATNATNAINATKHASNASENGTNTSENGTNATRNGTEATKNATDATGNATSASPPFPPFPPFPPMMRRPSNGTDPINDSRNATEARNVSSANASSANASSATASSATASLDR